MLQPALVSCRYLYWSLNGNVMKKKCPKKTSLSLEDFANFSAFLNILRRHLTLRFSGGQTFDLDQRIGYFWKDIIHIFHLTPSTMCGHWFGLSKMGSGIRRKESKICTIQAARLVTAKLQNYSLTFHRGLMRSEWVRSLLR